jgi:endo-alpha-N-acetylgalactosaminidase
MPWRRDQSLTGEPLRLANGAAYAKGLALHARTRLAYDLDGPCEEFRCVAGFDPALPPLGRVRLRILGDGKELWGRPDFRADEPPADIAVPLAGVRRLEIEVDFGADEDVCDRVHLGDARILRQAR